MQPDLFFYLKESTISQISLFTSKRERVRFIVNPTHSISLAWTGYCFHRVGSVRFGRRLSRNPNLGYLNRRARNSVFETPPRMILVRGTRARERVMEKVAVREKAVASSWPFLSSVNRPEMTEIRLFGAEPTRWKQYLVLVEEGEVVTSKIGDHAT